MSKQAKEPYTPVKHWFQQELFSGNHRSKFSPTERRVLDYAMFASWGRYDHERKKKGKKFTGHEQFECSGALLVEHIKGDSSLNEEEATRVLGGLVKRGVLECLRPAKGKHPGIYAIETRLEKWTAQTKSTGKTPRVDGVNTPEVSGKTPRVDGVNAQDFPGKHPAHTGKTPRVDGVNTPRSRGKHPGEIGAIQHKDSVSESYSNIDNSNIHVGASEKVSDDVAEFVRSNAQLFDDAPAPFSLTSAAIKILQQVIPGWQPSREEHRQLDGILATDCSDNLKIQAIEASTEDGRSYLDWARQNNKPRTAAARHMLKAASAHLGELIAEASGKKTVRKSSEPAHPSHATYFN